MTPYEKRARACGLDLDGMSSPAIDRTLNEMALEGNVEALKLHVLSHYSLKNPDWLLRNAIKNRLKVSKKRAQELLDLVRDQGES